VKSTPIKELLISGLSTARPAYSPGMVAHPTLVEALRGGIVESFHRGAVAVLDAHGQVHTALGDIDRPIFPRSAVKVLQALPLVASGAADALGLSDEELALACASHGGEAPHARTAAHMLAKAGLDASVLECGAHWPYHDGALKALAREGTAPSALHNNCSGKHAGFVCLGCHLAGGRDAAAFLRGYVQPGHAVMREVTAALQASTGFDLSDAAAGTDGCSIPTYAIPLRHLALAFARVATGQGLSDEHARAASRLRGAVAAAPFMVGGSGRLDTRLMEHFRERVFCKVGAEGVYCAALPTLGLGLALKMDDGNNARAAEVVLAALLQRLLRTDGADDALLAGISTTTLRNWNGIEVGQLRAVPELLPAA
jgi:L-asparaginase II